MFEARGRSNPDRIATLAGSAFTGEQQTEESAASIVEHLTCLDDDCIAPLQLVRGTTTRRAHFRHKPGTGSACIAGSPEGAWHLWVKTTLLADAFAHEHSVPGARVDAVVQRVGSKKLVAMEVQHSPILPEVVQRRHAAHRAAGMAGTVWIVPSSHLSGDRIETTWVAGLIEACLATPASAPGTPGYGCVVGFLDAETGKLHFIDRVKADVAGGYKTVTVTSWADSVSIEALSWWAQGSQRSTTAPAHLEAQVRTLDAVPTRRVKRYQPPWRGDFQ